MEECIYGKNNQVLEEQKDENKNNNTHTEIYLTNCNAENNGGKNNCYGMEIHCPQNGREGITNMCEIQGDSSSYELQSSNIYAQEGFNDLTIHTMRLYDTTIYCGKIASEYYCESNIYGTGTASWRANNMQ